MGKRGSPSFPRVQTPSLGHVNPDFEPGLSPSGWQTPLGILQLSRVLTPVGRGPTDLSQSLPDFTTAALRPSRRFQQRRKLKENAGVASENVDARLWKTPFVPFYQIMRV